MNIGNLSLDEYTRRAKRLGYMESIVNVLAILQHGHGLEELVRFFVMKAEEFDKELESERKKEATHEPVQAKPE